MIPALLAIPAVENLVGGVVDALLPHSPSTTDPSFATQIDQAAGHAFASSSDNSKCGTMTTQQWSNMPDFQKIAWTKSLTGRHVIATDEAGRTYSGLVGGTMKMGDVTALNIGGHLVSLSTLKQISWSPSTGAA